MRSRREADAENEQLGMALSARATCKSDALFYKHNAHHPPDFHARTVAPDVWVVFSWERN